MSQLPLFEGASQAQPAARSIARPKSPRSPRPKSARQQPLLTPPAATAQSIATPPATAIDRDSATRSRAAASDRPIPPAPPPAKELPDGWVDPKSPDFNYLKHCRLCGAPIKIGGLDHSLCSGDCGWVVDLVWQAQHPPRRSREPEPQAATHTDSSETETLDLFSDGLEGGEA